MGFALSVPHNATMRVLRGLGLGLLLLFGCGDSNSASQACSEICSLPDECFVELGIPAQGGDCVQTCEAQVEYVGVDCINAISATIACLGTCDIDLLTEEELLECQDEALAISPACEEQGID